MKHFILSLNGRLRKDPACLPLWLMVVLLGGWWLAVPAGVRAQQVLEPNLRYGKPSKAELALERYEPDTTATAVCLFRQGETHIVYENEFRQETEVKVRLKVLKPAGTSYAEVAIPYYAPANRSKAREEVSDVEGCTYNLENGKTVKTKLKRDQVSDERLDAYYRVLKFSLPDVRPGTVVEYRYKVESRSHRDIAPWLMQQEIPVVFSEYKIEIPLFYVYDIGFCRRDLIEMEEKTGTIQATVSERVGVSNVSDDKGDITTRRITFTSRNLPAVRTDEPFSYCPQEHCVQVNFNLQGTNFPNEGYRPLSQTWADVDKQLLESGGDSYDFFGRHLELVNPFRQETAARFGGKNLPFEESVAGAFGLLKEKLAWDGTYDLYGEDLAKVVADGRGSNADLNFVFISVLKNLGLKAFPVVMSQRSRGQLPTQFASLQRLNTFVVAVFHPTTGKFVFLDASMERPLFNVLPQELLVDRARILSSDLAEDQKWVNLARVAGGRREWQVEAVMDDTGRITGHLSAVYSGQDAVEGRRNRWLSAGDAWAGVAFADRRVEEGKPWESRVTEEADFITEVKAEGGRLCVTPMVLPVLAANPLVQPTRDLPLDFPWPEEVEMTCTLTLPEGFEVVELPQVSALSSDDNNLYIRYLLRHVGNRLVLTCSFGVADCTYPAAYYKELQRFFDRVVEACTRAAVLEKAPAACPDAGQ